jgi:hypothetical protein
MMDRQVRNVGWWFASSLTLLLLPTALGRATGAENAEPVLHLPRNADGWSVAQTENFRVLHNQPRAVAEQVAILAEKTRAAMFDKWFGKPADRWTPRCDIYLYATAEEYGRLTGVPSQMPGHSTTRGEGRRIVSRRIDLRYDYANLLTTVLPHEITHVVVADRFGEQGAPPWANEGMAVLSEPRNQMTKHTANIPRYWREGKISSASQLIRQTDYPPQSQMGSFYAQSVLLVDFLVAQKGARTFVDFLEGIRQNGYESAVQQHYGWTPSQMESHWQRRVQQETGSQTANRIPAGK